jgi:hypothetical protein
MSKTPRYLLLRSFFLLKRLCHKDTKTERGTKMIIALAHWDTCKDMTNAGVP